MWIEFETYAKTSVPNDVKIILFESGFNSLLSISVLKEQNLVQIENYLNSKRNIIELLKDYDKSEVFRLLPGHCSLIIGLASRVQSYLDQKPNKKSRRKFTHRRHFQSSSREQNSVNSSVTLKTETELKNDLINKLSNYFKNLNYSITFDIEKDIIDFIKETPKEIESENASEKNELILPKICFRCKLKCPFCDKFYTCTFISHWQVSNLEAHCKEHIALIEKEIQKTGENRDPSRELTGDGSASGSVTIEITKLEPLTLASTILPNIQTNLETIAKNSELNSK